MKTQVAALVNSDPSIEELIEKSHASISKPGDPPTARHLHELHDKIAATVNKFMSKRGEVCDRSMRQLVQRRKERLQEEREQQAAREVERARMKKEEERAARKEREKEKDKTDKTPSKKRTHDEMDVDADDADADEKERKEQRASLPSVGAHGVARQDGVGVHQGEFDSATLSHVLLSSSRTPFLSHAATLPQSTPLLQLAPSADFSSHCRCRCSSLAARPAGHGCAGAHGHCNLTSFALRLRCFSQRSARHRTPL